VSPRRVLERIGSWWVTALLLLVPAAAYLVLSFGRNPYPAWLQFLLHAPAGMAVILALIVNLIAASMRIALDRLRRPAVTAALVRSQDIYTALPLSDGAALRRAAELFLPDLPADATVSRGFRRVTGAWSFIPGTVLRAGIVLTLASLLVSSHSRKVYETSLSEGERKDILGSSVTVVKIDAALPADFLQVGDDSTFRLEGLAVRMASGGREHTVTPGLPSRFNGLFWRVRHLGIAQPLAFSMPGMRIDQTVHLNVLPPGRTDVVPLPKGDRFLTFSLDPEKVITKGLMTGRQFDLAHPAYRVVLQAGTGGTPQGRRVKPGGRFELGDDAALTLGTPGLFVRLQVVSDPALLLLYAGIIIVLAGTTAMVSRFFWYERELVMAVEGATLLIGWRDEFFKKWGIHRFQRWKEELEQGHQGKPER
jgi:hypothetical protein